MTAYIHHLETLVPPYHYRQDDARERMIQWLPGKKTRRLIQRIYDYSGIETRCSVLPDFIPGTKSLLFHEDPYGRIVEPSTEPRNQYYAKWARKLAVEVCGKALKCVTGIRPEDVTHVITASCTGFSNPGPDLFIVKDLDLPDTVERYHLGFMGCYAALPAMRMAQQFCLARPDAVVLVVCLELCSLHLQLREEPDNLLANSLFADGAAAAVISARPPVSCRPALALHSFSSSIVPESLGEMAWSIGDRGFNIQLSTYVPNIIAQNIAPIADNIFASSPWNRYDIGHWAVHPGGRAILDKVEKELGLAPNQIADSRAILRSFGNMSSATILFVLQRMLADNDEAGDKPLCAMAFGPGLTIESVLLERIPRHPANVHMEDRAHVQLTET